MGVAREKRAEEQRAVETGLCALQASPQLPGAGSAPGPGGQHAYASSHRPGEGEAPYGHSPGLGHQPNPVYVACDTDI